MNHIVKPNSNLAKRQERWELKGTAMLHRREFLLGSMGAGIVALGSCAAAATQSIEPVLKETVGPRENIAGIVAIVVDENGSHMASYGSSGVVNLAMDGDTVFEIGSITKVLTALMLANMALRGEVAFDDPVAKYLPPSVTLGVRGRPITLLDLATYTSGLPKMPSNMPPGWNVRPNPLADYTTDMLYEFLSGYVPEYEPGARYEYSNLGFGLLGAVIARHAGKSYEELLIERVCDPLGLGHMRITLSPDMRKHVAQGHNLDRQPAPLLDMPGLQGAGAVRANAKDLTVFLEACMGLKKTPLNRALARLLETRRPTTLAGTDAGLGWFISSDGNEEIVWKSGATSGFNTCIAFSTRRHRAALVLSNFLWRSVVGGPVDAGTINMSMRLINSDFHPGDFMALYR